MKSVVQFFKTTLTGGVLFLLPIAVAFVVLREVARQLARLVKPIAQHIPAESFVGVAMADLIAILVLIAVAFVAGLIARTGIGAKLNLGLDRFVLKKMPGFTLLKEVAGRTQDREFRARVSVALAQIDQVWRLAFIVDAPANGMLTLFIPSAPTPSAGSLCFVNETQVKRLNVSVGTAVKCITQLGVDSRQLLDLAPVFAESAINPEGRR